MKAASPKEGTEGAALPAASVASSRRLIEDWLPIAALGIESTRERTPMTPFPAPNRLHVWWARRPLVASRAAILGALLPANADRHRFMHALGIHGDPVEAKRLIAAAARDKDPKTGKRRTLAANPYGYERAFKYQPNDDDLGQLRSLGVMRVLDPTAGGGSIPFEAIRLGCKSLANDLNPVAWMILRATMESPARFGSQLAARYQVLTARFCELAKPKFSGIFAPPPEGVTIDGMLWARTIRCPYCNGLVPLSPNWSLSSGGTGVRLVPDTSRPGDRRIRFEIVHEARDQSLATVKGGDGACPFSDCARVIDGDEIKAQAQAGKMGDQLYAVVFKRTVRVGTTKAGKPKVKKERGYRAPCPEDEFCDHVAATLTAKMPEWEARGIVPDEPVPDGLKTSELIRYGATSWRDCFSPRQLIGHITSVEIFQQLVAELGDPARLSDLDRAALTYLAIANDKLLNYNSRMSVWMPTREVVANTFNRHDFAFCWSYAEMAPIIAGLGYDWAFESTGKALEELIELLGHDSSPRDKPALFAKRQSHDVTITCGSGDRLDHIADASVDAVVMDPPYYDNVMYAELADYFYVWLKRTAGLLYPDVFSAHLTDKEREAVANAAKFKGHSRVQGSGGAKERAARDYRERMQAIFTECRRVLKPDGVMVLMFTHKATGAWDALSKGLVDAGFVISASWPVNTEAEGSLHIKGKNAAKSTIFLVCRPRAAGDGKVSYWEDVEHEVVERVREKVAEFQHAGIGGVDLYLACFGPALEVFSRHWPLQRGRPAQKPEVGRSKKLRLREDEDFDPYAVRPEDALMAARTAVKEWRIHQLASVRRQAHLDPITEWFVLAWDTFQTPVFPADEALKLARVVGVPFEQLRGRVLELKSDDVILWDSATRANKGVLATAKAGASLIDVLHHVARTGREQNVGAAVKLLEETGLLADPSLHAAVELALNVLPAPRAAEGSKVGAMVAAAADAYVLEQVRRTALAKDVKLSKERQEEFEGGAWTQKR
ncbi:MAG: DUF1156 domain-containing protein [Planctomycetota bacterium]